MTCRRHRWPAGVRRPGDLLARFLLNAVAYLVAAAVAAGWSTATGSYQAHWLALHLAFVGAVSLMVLGAGQFFATAFLMTDAPGPRLVRAQLAVWNAGVLAVAVGVPRGHRMLTDAGAALLVAGLALFALALRGLTRRSLQRAPWAVRWYVAAAVFLGVGAVVGAAMAGGAYVAGGSLLGAHIALNVAGWFGTAIVGTLHTFYPSLTHSRLRHPRLQSPTFGAWTGGVAMLAVGYGIGDGPGVVAGWLALAAASAMLTANLVASRRAATELRLPARLVGAAQPFLVAGVVVGLVAAIRHGAAAPLAGAERTELAYLLVAGWVGMTVAGSLLHLLSILGRIRSLGRQLPPARPARDVVLTAAAVLAVTAGAAGRLLSEAAIQTSARFVLGAVAAALAALMARELVAVLRGLAVRRGSPAG